MINKSNAPAVVKGHVFVKTHLKKYCILSGKNDIVPIRREKELFKQN